MSRTASIAKRRRLEGCSIATALSMETLRYCDFDSCRAEAAGPTRGLVQSRLFRPLQPGHRRHHHLRNAIAALDGEDLLAVVYQDHADLAAIIGVDRAGRVQGGDA